jgi:hypothetical protein
MSSILSHALAFISGGFVFKFIDYCIEWAKEKREQRREQTSHDKDRPRVRVDISKGKGTHSHIPTLIMEILSLGGLPLTINEGEAFITTSQYPERVQSHQLNGGEVSPFAPIKFEFSLPLNFTNPSGVGKPVIKLVCQFSYGKDNEPYRYEKTYNHDRGWFE